MVMNPWVQVGQAAMAEASVLLVAPPEWKIAIHASDLGAVE